MLTSHARVATDRPGRYLVQLCKHFAHKVEAQWTDERGFADFGWGTCTLIAEEDSLLLTVQAPDADGLVRVKYVVQDHTERFGVRDELKVTWSEMG